MQSLGFKDPPAMRRWTSGRLSRIRKDAVKRGKKWAKGLRSIATDEEIILQGLLSSLGYKVVPQKDFFFESKPHTRIVDMWLPDFHIAIEADGVGHFTKRGRGRDVARSIQFKNEYPHFRFLRYRNEEIREEGFRRRLALDLEKIIL